MTTELYNLPLEEALSLRWSKGASELRAGSPEWVGQPPMIEAYEEVLDIINYVREAHNQGYVETEDRHYIERETKALAQLIRKYISEAIK